ncbi:MAG: hypothetical protein MUO51_01585 [Woeseiaceae bacterium]|jgi:ABC-type tungstate transport system substrate-binding protein|nr:hypothetical protein [Woeseiaceae bacterium]TFG41411.1 MAG: hypothetical protein E4H42_02090 [Chromatiales bacterium]
MTVENALAVLGWCMVVNFGILMIWAVAMMVAPNLTYRTQRLVTSISQEEFERTIYRLMGQYKLGILFFNFAPYIALRIVFT